jgi:hypothetical protein
MTLGVEWLRVRDEVVSALATVMPFPCKHIAETPLFKCATALLSKAAELYSNVPEAMKQPRGRHYMLICGIVRRSSVFGMSENQCTYVLWDVLDEYLDKMN